MFCKRGLFFSGTCIRARVWYEIITKTQGLCVGFYLDSSSRDGTISACSSAKKIMSSKSFVNWYEIVIIPPAQRSCWGGILVSLRPSVRPSVRLSVRPSVRPSVPHAVSALYHLQLWMDSFHIRHKWSLPWEGVSRTMTFDLDLYL